MDKGISFLYSYYFGNRNIENPGLNIVSITSTAEGDFFSKFADRINKAAMEVK